MNRKLNILAAFLILALLLTACGAGGDRVERFAEANPGSGENIAIPGYEKLDFAAGKTAQNHHCKGQRRCYHGSDEPRRQPLLF